MRNSVGGVSRAWIRQYVDDYVTAHGTAPHIATLTAPGAGADAGAALTTAVADAVTNGKLLVCLPGTYRFTTSPTFVSHAHVYFCPGAVITNAISDGTNSWLALSGTLTETATTLSSNADEGDNTIAVASAANLEADDWLWLAYGGTPATDSYGRHQMVQIASIDGTTITLKEALRDSFATANCDVNKIVPLEDVWIDGGGALWSCTTSHTGRDIQMTRCKDVHVANFRADESAGGLGAFALVFNGACSRCSFENISILSETAQTGNIHGWALFEGGQDCWMRSLDLRGPSLEVEVVIDGYVVDCTVKSDVNTTGETSQQSALTLRDPKRCYIVGGRFESTTWHGCETGSCADMHVFLENVALRSGNVAARNGFDSATRLGHVHLTRVRSVGYKSGLYAGSSSASADQSLAAEDCEFVGTNTGGAEAVSWTLCPEREKVHLVRCIAKSLSGTGFGFSGPAFIDRPKVDGVAIGFGGLNQTISRVSPASNITTTWMLLNETTRVRDSDFTVPDTKEFAEAQGDTPVLELERVTVTGSTGTVGIDKNGKATRVRERQVVWSVASQTSGTGTCTFNRGTVTLNGTTPVAVSFPDIKAADQVKLTRTTAGATAQSALPPTITVTPGTGFAVVSATENANDVFAYEIG